LAIAPTPTAAAGLLARMRIAAGDTAYTPSQDLVVAIAAPHLLAGCRYDVNCNGGGVGSGRGGFDGGGAALAVVRLATEVARAGALPPLAAPPPSGTCQGTGKGNAVDG
ncbi:hypothetical protein Vretifemale_12267, partial [Volvox reticuliferus]